MILKVNHSKELQCYLDSLFHINRSLTGKGNRDTLRRLKEIIPIKVKSIKSGTQVYDWSVPKEWIVNDAWIKDEKGEMLLDLNKNNLHLFSNSASINKKISWPALKKHLHTNKKRKNTIEYRTTYYKNNWGFSVSYNQYMKIKNSIGKYNVHIDSSFRKNGKMNYGEILIKGKSSKEILISTYICHPSMANDNLSGVLCTAFLAREIKK